MGESDRMLGEIKGLLEGIDKRVESAESKIDRILSGECPQGKRLDVRIERVESMLTKFIIAACAAGVLGGSGMQLAQVFFQ